MVETLKAWSLDVASFFGLEAGETAQEIQIYVDRMSDGHSPVVRGTSATLSDWILRLRATFVLSVPLW